MVFDAWGPVVTFVLLLAYLAHPDAPQCDRALERYAHLSQAQSETCAELRRLAVACSGPDDDVLDYMPRRCGGNVAK